MFAEAERIVKVEISKRAQPNAKRTQFLIDRKRDNEDDEEDQPVYCEGSKCLACQ